MDSIFRVLEPIFDEIDENPGGKLPSESRPNLPSYWFRVYKVS